MFSNQIELDQIVISILHVLQRFHILRLPEVPNLPEATSQSWTEFALLVFKLLLDQHSLTFVVICYLPVFKVLISHNKSIYYAIFILFKIIGELTI